MASHLIFVLESRVGGWLSSVYFRRGLRKWRPSWRSHPHTRGARADQWWWGLGHRNDTSLPSARLTARLQEMGQLGDGLLQSRHFKLPLANQVVGLVFGHSPSFNTPPRWANIITFTQDTRPASGRSQCCRHGSALIVDFYVHPLLPFDKLLFSLSLFHSLFYAHQNRRLGE